MLTFDNGSRMVEPDDELPNLSGARHLYLDFEATSFNRAEGAFNPWAGHRILGAAVTADDIKGAWYVPLRHKESPHNYPLEKALRWLRDVVGTCEDWINHNIKFDAHFAHAEGIVFNGRLIDTLTLSKIIDSDRMHYNLTDLMKDWCNKDINPYEERLHSILKQYHPRSYDYADVPADIMAEYAGEDVISNRELYHHMLKVKPEQVSRVWETEIKLTPVLFDMEEWGMPVDPDQLKTEHFKAVAKMVMLEEKLHKTLGWAMRPHTNADCYEALCNHFGLPTLGYTDSGEPSFDKKVMAQYAEHPLVRKDPKCNQIIQWILAYRKLHTHVGFYLEPYQRYQVDGIMHPDYNQAVRTGRMSCRRPNAQNLDTWAKSLIKCPPGEGLLVYDYNQIEFRLIVHYIQNHMAIKAYNEDPNTDFHAWTAEQCHIKRRSAKNINFGIGFGAGQAKIIQMLRNNPDVLEEAAEYVDKHNLPETQREFAMAAFAEQRAKAMYASWHALFPELRRVSKQASFVARGRGYVYNAYGRRRHLQPKFCYKAFNSVIQPTAADVMKERTVAIAPRYNSWSRDVGLKLFAIVHDETAIRLPIEASKDEHVQREIARILCDTDVKFRVPITVAYGWSDKTWADAKA